MNKVIPLGFIEEANMNISLIWMMCGVHYRVLEIMYWYGQYIYLSWIIQSMFFASL